MTTEIPDNELEGMKIDDIREKLKKTLIEDFDASPHLAEEAAARVTTDDSDDFDNIDELAEFVHDNSKFWDD